MRRIGTTGIALALTACASAPRPPPPPPAATEAPAAAPARPRPVVTLRHASPDEKATAEQLDRLVARYDVTPWLFTREIVVDEEAIPHSHPVLTLHTRHLRDDLLLLSTLVHEQSHWYLEAHQADVALAVEELRSLFPGLPVGFPDGAQSDTSSYEHLIVIALEERGVVRLAGELAARQMMDFFAGDHYRALYQLVAKRRDDVWRIMRAHRLDSPAASAEVGAAGRR